MKRLDLPSRTISPESHRMPPITVPVGHKMVQNNVESYRKKKERDLKVEMNQRDLAGPKAMLLSR